MTQFETRPFTVTLCTITRHLTLPFLQLYCKISRTHALAGADIPLLEK